jgi:nucleoside-diphosphate-sugar epimerase
MRVKDARQTFLGIWIRHLLEGMPIQVFGSGKQRRDFNFIDDVVEALLRAAADPASEGQIFNLGHSEHVTLYDLAAMLVRLRPGTRFEVVPFPADREAIDIGDYYSDYSKIKATLGWDPAVRLADGVARTVDYYERHRAHYWNANE